MRSLLQSRPIQVTIHQEALRNNLAVLRHAAGSSKVWAVVKANAYGHGISRIYQALRSADGIACLELTEAQILRDLGWRGPLLLLEGVFHPRDLEVCSRLNIWHTVHCDEQIDWLAAHKTGEAQRIFLKLNSGMNRLGFLPDAYRSAYIRLSQLPQVAEVSHMTHLSDADSHESAGQTKTQQQWQIFESATNGLPGETSIANSAATLHLTEPHAAWASADWVRVGIALYGSSPDHPFKTANQWGLQPTMTLSSCVIGTQQIAAGQAVGYGSAFVAPHSMRIGTVACGYADGYPRSVGLAMQGAPVLVDGQRSRTLGRISMDMLTIDLTHLPQCGVGSPVTLWGQGLNIDEVAQAAGTISHELMCAITARVPFFVETKDTDAVD